MNVYTKYRNFIQARIHPAIIDTVHVTGATYFATLQGYIIFETELYVLNTIVLLFQIAKKKKVQAIDWLSTSTHMAAI